MLDFFAIFSKGGIVLWYFQGTTEFFTSSVNALIKSVILQERSGNEMFTHGSLALKHRLDNEFDLIYVVAYQKILQLSYIDKFLTDIQLEFRDKYKQDLHDGSISGNFDFSVDFERILKKSEKISQIQAKQPRKMKTYDESQKSKKTVASMIESKKDDQKGKAKDKSKTPVNVTVVKEVVANGNMENMKQAAMVGVKLDQEQIEKNRQKFYAKQLKKPETKSPGTQSTAESKKRVKKGTVWNHGGSKKDLKELDFSQSNGNGTAISENDIPLPMDDIDVTIVGTAKGNLQDMDEDSSETELTEDDDDDTDEENEAEILKMEDKHKSKKSSGIGMFSLFKNLVGSKTLSAEDMEPVLEKLKEHLCAKNVAIDIATKLCDSVAVKLEGKVLGTFTGVTSTVKQTLHESCLQILSPKRRIDILRDVLEVKQRHQRPFVITFCGVNGVGKSTNLAKVTFWLIENGLRVLIAACDTFRAGAVEQLRTHERKLNALHPPEKHSGVQMAKLFERGYGKDSAGIAIEAIKFARDGRYDVVLIDTAGRMQDNEPLMRALTKLIKVNQPDLVLFVGEALVGNEAIDQLVKFNRALADHSNTDQPRLIDGIILTKFDTIDDKVGAAISMTYTTGQPIVFVGTGQTYTDLKNLNARAVVNALLK